MRIDSSLDTGPMLLKYETEIAPDETAPELYARLADAGAPLVVETLRGLASGTLTPTPQDNSQATLAPPLKKEDGRINWSLPAHKIYNRIRGFQPWPGAFTTFRGKQCAIWGKPAPDQSVLTQATVGASLRPARTIASQTGQEMPGTISANAAEVHVACGEHTALRLEFVQLEGRNKISAREFANGARLASGETFGT
jgi:methionyl-tRNA formyltransferase